MRAHITHTLLENKAEHGGTEETVTGGSLVFTG